MQCPRTAPSSTSERTFRRISQMQDTSKPLGKRRLEHHVVAPQPGGEIEFHLHNSSSGTAGTDRTKIRFMFSRRNHPWRCSRVRSSTRISEYPLARGMSARTRRSRFSRRRSCGYLPHTHLRGKRREYRVVMPDGTERMGSVGAAVRFQLVGVLHVKEPIRLPTGSRIVSSDWYATPRRTGQIPIVISTGSGAIRLGGNAIRGTSLQRELSVGADHTVLFRRTTSRRIRSPLNYDAVMRRIPA